MTFAYTQYLHTYFVDGSYTGTSDGTFARPYKRVHDAYAVAADGDALVIRGGNYPEGAWSLRKQLRLYNRENAASVQ